MNPDIHDMALPGPGSEVDGRYTVIRTIGEGGFGWVFEVEHKLLGQRFAMKILHPEIAGDEDWILRFREEAKATGLVRHESIVFVTDFGACSQYGYYFVMEYLDGETLARYLRRTPRVDLGMIRNLMATVAGGIGAVHELDIVHCDLKPANVILIDRRDRAPLFKFLDFGTSTLVLESARSDMLYGTPAYMAPEQAKGDPVDVRADQFSIGCILYEMLTGQQPWAGKEWKDAFPEERLARMPPEIHFIRGDVTERLNHAVMRAISLGRDERWPNVERFAEAVIDAIDEIQRNQEAAPFEPLADPMDIVAGTQSIPYRRMESAPSVHVPNAIESLVIELTGDSELDDEDEAMRIELSVVYRTAERLRREWRRNVIAGGMFLPTEQTLPIDTRVRIMLTFLPARISIEFDAVVISHRDDDFGSPLGFGIRFDEAVGRRLRRFARSLEVGVEMNAGDLLRRIPDASLPENLTTGETFLLSRLDVPIAVGRARALFSGLPFDFDEITTQLLDRQLIAIESVDDDDIPTLSAIPTQSTQERELQGHRLSSKEIRQVNETVAQFVAQRNYLAAMHVLRNAVVFADDRPEFHSQIAEIAYRFAGDHEGARAAITRALELSPDDPYLRSLADDILH